MVENKPVFTIGNAPVISDTDNFSEVSLDRDGNSSEVGQSDLQTDLANPFYPSPLSDLDSYNNLQTLHDLQNQPPPTLDINSNNQQTINDANINPISAFGTAASTVFSTFSNIIKGSTSQTRIEDQQYHHNQPPQIQEQSSFTSETYQDNQMIPPNPYAPYNIQQDTSAPPPSFFTPGDEMLFNKRPQTEVPSNTFRLGGHKKKTYAPIPGFSSTSQSQNVPQNFNLNPVMPPLPPQTVTHVDSMPNFQPPPPLPQQSYYDNNNVQQQQQPQKPAQMPNLEKSSNKFSFSSLLDKIPVPLSLFGSSEQNSNETSYNYQNQPQASVYQQQNYFAPQMPEPQIINSVQQEQQVPLMNNYFNSQQNFESENLTIATDSINIQKSDVTQIKENIPQTVNFFNPQQFNTTPFSKVQQPPMQKQQQGIESTESQTKNDDNNSSPAPVMMMSQNQFMPQSFSSPPPVMTPSTDNNNYQQVETQSADLTAPPIFYNPVQASELFKSRQNDDGKPKNPYSNTRMRGVGLYRARTSSSSDSSNVQQMFIPPAASSPSSQLFTPTQNFSDAVDHSKESSRPPSIPLSSSSNNTTPRATPIQSFEPQVMNFNIPTQVAFSQPQLTPVDVHPVQKKSDLNVPDSENETIPLTTHEQKIQPESTSVSNVSNFFAYDNNKVNEQVSALNFFHVNPEVNSQPVIDSFGGQKQDKLASHNDSLNAINFFAMDTTVTNTTSVPKSDEMQQCIENENENEYDEDINRKEENQEEFNSPITSSTMQGSDLVNDITDKMESLSACSRSTLSLFATSELDSTMGQKLMSSAPVESLIPKYLEQQPQMGANLKQSESLVNGSHHIEKYRPIYCHWFYQNLYWHPFSMTDSMAIDQAILNGDEFVYTSGGRYEVNIKDRRRSSIYWMSGSNAIRKCSWFFMDEKNGNQNLIPYDEHTGEFLEKEYEKAMTSATWNHKIHLPNSHDVIVMKDPNNIELHKLEQILVVKRGIDEFDIDDGEEGIADHLIICVSGFGDKIDENADEVRTKCLETIQQYYSEAFDCGQIKRIEVLPIILNSIDVLKMFEINNNILNALPSKSPSREINEHVMRAMLYSNENFYQKIMNHLAFSLNEIVSKFNQRNSDFSGEISVMSSSYEALFLFDMLANDNTSEFWQLNFDISKFFACGMPASLLMIRNGDRLKHGFELTRCKKLFNFIHPADDIAQRIEPLLIPEYSKLPPESAENLTAQERIDFIMPEDSALEKFNSSNYFSSEILIRRITNEIYGANHIQMDSGSL
ncbi:uncharacterized protein [Chironomus tepperi]|uniref:uncharacterized protein n=1 Tax=Chironomus tepperi TaxID=113505 RepID=UPI00391FBA03